MKKKKKKLVGVNYFVLSVTDINAARGKFHADFYLDLHYDVKVGKKGLDKDEIDWKQEWNPGVDFVNADGPVTKSFENFIATEIKDRKDVTHKITYQTRITGVFTSQMNLRYFPFDSQRLQIHLESGEYMSDELDMRKEPGCGLNVSKDLREHGLVEWELNEVRDFTKVETLEFDGSTLLSFEKNLTPSSCCSRRILLNIHTNKIRYVFQIHCVMYNLTKNSILSVQDCSSVLLHCRHEYECLWYAT